MKTKQAEALKAVDTIGRGLARGPSGDIEDGRVMNRAVATLENFIHEAGQALDALAAEREKVRKLREAATEAVRTWNTLVCELVEMASPVPLLLHRDAKFNDLRDAFIETADKEG